MRENGIDKLEFLVVLAVAGLVNVVAASSGPAYSADTRIDPAEMRVVSTVRILSAAEISPATTQFAQATDESRDRDRAIDTDGYQWSGSRPAAERYLWSHQKN